MKWVGAQSKRKGVLAHSGKGGGGGGVSIKICWKNGLLIYSF